MEELAEQAFRRHYRQIYGYVRRRSPTAAEAEDVAAEVFADAAAALQRFEPGATPVLAWLYTVAQRRLADAARRRHRGEALPEVAAPAYPVEVGRAIRRALAALPDEQRRVVVLKLLRGLSFGEISSHVNATEAACKMRFSRALAQMRDSLQQEGVHS